MFIPNQYTPKTDLTLQQIATLVTDAHVTPSLALVIRRASAGNPVADFAVDDLLVGLADLRAAIDTAERELLAVAPHKELVA